ncbi:uncharacterized protein DS421_16g534460 [Arachis hypogaea]|nr:uncharacterized protein DS421_16g534460 [Arachis hypogaea]
MGRTEGGDFTLVWCQRGMEIGHCDFIIHFIKKLHTTNNTEGPITTFRKFKISPAPNRILRFVEPNLKFNELTRSEF